MSDDEINEEICKFLGWKFSDHPDHIAKTALWATAKSFVIKPDGDFVFRHSIPRFTDSLDLMHEAEKKFLLSIHRCDVYLSKAKNEANRYFEQLKFVCGAGGCEHPIHATARQRAEAFLRTVGKWEEEA